MILAVLPISIPYIATGEVPNPEHEPRPGHILSRSALLITWPTHTSRTNYIRPWLPARDFTVVRRSIPLTLLRRPLFMPPSMVVYAL